MPASDSSSQALLDSLISALLRDEDWRLLVEDTLDPELARLMQVAETIHRSAGGVPKAGPRERLSIWRRLRPRLDGQDASAGGSLIIHGFTGARRWRSPGRFMGAFGRAPGVPPYGWGTP